MVLDLDVFKAQMFRVMFRESVHNLFLEKLESYYCNRFTAEIPGFVRWVPSSVV